MRATALKSLSEREVSTVAEPRRVLVVDDDADIRAALAEWLREDGAEVVEARSGGEAYEAIGRAMREEPPRYFDLVISDLQMPDGSGFDFLWVLRFTDYPVPVVLLSGLVDSATRARARKLGAAAILEKPLDPERLHSIALAATARPWWYGRRRE